MISELIEQGWSGLSAAGDCHPIVLLLATLYGQPWRFYHTAEHIARCAEAYAQIRLLWKSPAEAALALAFHDAVYVPGASDNERQSAALCAALLRAHRVHVDSASRVNRYIMATAHHGEPIEPDEALIADVDLVILGADPAAFDVYEEQIRREYSFVEECVFRAGRAAVLRQFLARRHVFTTDWFRARYETAARANLERSLQKLSSV